MNNWRVGTLAAALGLAGCYGTGVGIHEEATFEVPADECVSDTTTIFAGQHIDAGDVEISSDGTNLVVGISGDNGWLVSEYHVYAGTGPVPVNRAGAPAPGQFPYRSELADPVASIDVTIPLDGLGVECGDSLNVAVHTVMVLVEDGVVVDTQTGWGYGPNEYRRQWGWWFTTDICCEEPPDGCVRVKGAWREIPALWPVSELDVGGVTYDACELDGILYTGPDDGWVSLAHQYIAARLNEAAGAYVDDDTAADLAAADALLAAGHGDAAVTLGLYDFNNGLRDTPSCDPQWLAAACLAECAADCH
jgi:hypothetical protein